MTFPGIAKRNNKKSFDRLYDREIRDSIPERLEFRQDRPARMISESPSDRKSLSHKLRSYIVEPIRLFQRRRQDNLLQTSSKHFAKPDATIRWILRRSITQMDYFRFSRSSKPQETERQTINGTCSSCCSSPIFHLSLDDRYRTIKVSIRIPFNHLLQDLKQILIFPARTTHRSMSCHVRIREDKSHSSAGELLIHLSSLEI